MSSQGHTHQEKPQTLLDRPSFENLKNCLVKDHYPTQALSPKRSISLTASTVFPSLLAFIAGASADMNIGPTAIGIGCVVLNLVNIAHTIRLGLKNHMQLEDKPLSYPAAKDKVNDFIHSLMAPTLLAQDALKDLPRDGKPLDERTVGKLLVVPATDPLIPEAHRQQLAQARLCYANHQASLAGEKAILPKDKDVATLEKAALTQFGKLPKTHPFRLATDTGAHKASTVKQYVHTAVKKDKRVDQNKFNAYFGGYAFGLVAGLLTNPLVMSALTSVVGSTAYTTRRQQLDTKIARVQTPLTYNGFVSEYIAAKTEERQMIRLKKKSERRRNNVNSSL